MDIKQIILLPAEIRTLRMIKSRKIISNHNVANALCKIGLAEPGIFAHHGNIYVYRITDDGLRYLEYLRMYIEGKRWEHGITLLSLLLSIIATLTAVFSLLKSQ